MHLRNAFVRMMALSSMVTVSMVAQKTTAELVGTVTDTTGAVVPGAKISVSNESTGIRRDSVSNELGYYTIALLPPGEYRIAVGKEGFRPVTRTGVALQVDQVARIDFAMEVGTITEAVEVMGNVTKVDTHTATLKEVVDQRRIQ